MRIIYFTQFYPPEHIAGAFRASDHSKLWSELGNSVTVFTGWPNYPTGKVFDGYSVESLAQETVDGVRILRSKSIIESNDNSLKRVVAGASFLVYGVINCLAKKELVGTGYDVAVASCGPVFTGVLGYFYSRIRKTPFVVEFRDVTFKQMVATGAPEKSRKVSLVKSLELLLCRKASHVVVLTKGFAEVLSAEGVYEGKLSVVPNGADIVACDHAFSGELRFGYFGTMGISQDVARTLDYLRTLADSGHRVSYLLIGEGAVRASIQEAMESGGYPFAVLEHGMSKDELEAYYAKVDMTVVSLQKSESFSATVPSKIFQSFARGVPVLYIGPEGEAARLVRESGAGITLCGTAEEDLDGLARFSARSDLASVLEEMSLKAVSFMEQKYTRRRMAENMLSTFEGLLDADNLKRR